MKSKINNREEQLEELEEIDESAVDVEPIGPAISTGKTGKIKLIAVSAFLIAIVVYIFFFSGGGDKAQENLKPVAQPTPVAITQNEDGSSPFSLEEEGYDLIGQEEVVALEAPPIPEIPTLPDLPKKEKDQDIKEIIAEAEAVKAKNEKKDEAEDKKNDLLQIIKPELINPVQDSGKSSLTKEQLSPFRSNNSVEQDSKVAANLNPRYAPIVVFSGPAQGTPSRSVGYEKNIVSLKQNSINDLEESESDVKTTIIADRANTIAQGKLISAVLETAINTEVPGFVRAIVSRDVFGESGNHILIPRGSRLFGSYSSEIKRGQGRVDISWTRLIRPDGVDLGIDFNASDQFGRAGIQGDVDNKYQSIIANSILTSILTVGSVSLAEKLLDNDSDASTTTTDPTTGTTTTTGSASNQAIYDVSKTIIDTVGTVLENQVNTDPLITVPQGSRITVIVNSDINVPEMTR